MDELRLQPLSVGDVNEEALRHPPPALGVVGHRVRLVADPDLGAVARKHPVLRPEGLAGLPVLLVRGDCGHAIVGVDAARPELRIVHELVGSIAEDAGDLRAHVGEATAVGDVRIGQVDVDRGRDVLDEHLQARAGLLDLARRLLEGRGRAVQATHEDGAGAEDGAKDDENADEDVGRDLVR